MKRAIPSEFPAKFVKHKVRPTRCHYVSSTPPGSDPGHPCLACALGIEAIDAAGYEAARSANSSVYLLAQICGFSQDYADGLDDGWQEGRAYKPDNPEYMSGFADGVAAAEASFIAAVDPAYAE